MTLFLQMVIAFTVCRLSERFILWVGRLLWEKVGLWAWSVACVAKAKLN
jgi:hypothetical protein